MTLKCLDVVNYDLKGSTAELPHLPQFVLIFVKNSRDFKINYDHYADTF